ncbi:hypothetical protein [Nitratireductor pacificus]|uniref:Uncharacterized protein n=1 Tax=Nitratireductor pacificus pht-3B TaxID=391937 RepID=K2N804_9HYPH|nr:hypothetical protein [Nitratireductor pacificus]EKF20213.1 hypothetical protein NA2_03127 [Nitratireductor pacificus pht-3B]
MNRTASAFLLVTGFTGLLAALSFALQVKGYGFGSLGIARLDEVASSATFVPLAALYALAGALIAILPLRAAGLVHANAATPVYSTTLVLLATIVGLQIARFAFGNDGALWVLLDWRFGFAGAVIAAHLFLDALRRNALLRTLAFIGFCAATLACLYWSFRL